MIEERQGMFGPVAVQDFGLVRELRINDQVQGGCYHVPAAKAFGARNAGPGCVPTSRYMAGWMLAGVDNQQGSGVMVGLGSGVGPCAIIANFPEVDLTVVEIDPAVIELAEKYFPLLTHYQDLGRLRIVQADALEWLARTEDTFDFACADGYTGQNEIVSSYMPRLLELADRTYVNCIDKVGGESYQNLLGLMADFGKPATELMCCGGYSPMMPQNIIVTNVTNGQAGARESFVPFEKLPYSDSVARFRHLYHTLLSRLDDPSRQGTGLPGW